MVDIAREKKEIDRHAWLNTYEATEEDVFEDTQGKEFIMVDIDDDEYRYDKVYLPDEIQSTYVYF